MQRLPWWEISLCGFVLVAALVRISPWRAWAEAHIGWAYGAFGVAIAVAIAFVVFKSIKNRQLQEERRRFLWERAAKKHGLL